jgi:Acyl-coenzyme A:6-aminopenicillanic acid acyl-transferase
MENRTCHLKGTAKEIGVFMGQALREKLAQNIELYIRKCPLSPEALDSDNLRTGAIPWLNSLPERFQDELKGMAEGANVSLQTIAEWNYVEQCIQEECSGFICLMNGHAWLGRNNDTYVPELWGYMTIREVENRLPTISFSMEGDVFSPTGINRERLWLHYNYLPVCDSPRMDKPHFPGYVLLTEALETCSTINEVERLLNQYDRDGGMMLFALDGKTDEFVIFECTCREYFKRIPNGEWLVGTNHYCTCQTNFTTGTSETRYRRVEELVKALYLSKDKVNLPMDLIAILADADVEVNGENFGTVYANIACPSAKQVWYTFGGYPAASKGNWQLVVWPWIE